MIDRALLAFSGMVCPVRYAPLPTHAYEQAVESYFGTGQAFAFSKGRIALYAILRALGIGSGDEVILPGYTCVMAAAPVLYCGARPVYADIDPQTYNMRVDEVNRLLSPRTKAIVVQHTYGIPADMAGICHVAATRGIPVVEDCCHTFGGRIRKRRLGTLGAAAFFSGQWNKPFSTGLGGMALVHIPDLVPGVRAQQEQLPLQSRKTVFMLAAQLLAYELLVRPSVASTATRLFRWLTAKGMVVGSSSEQEYGAELPREYGYKASPVQCRIGRREVLRIEGNVRARTMATERYFAELPGLGFGVPRLPEGADAMLLRFPVRVANKQDALDQAGRYGAEIGSWFECPLHPKETELRAFGYREGDCPAAEKASLEVINLPTHRRVGERDFTRTLTFLRDVCRPAI